MVLSFLRLGFLTVYLTEPFISGFTTGAAVHVFTSQIPSVFGLKTPRGIHGPFKLPKFYIKVFHSLFYNINWISTAIAFISIIILYLAKYFNDRYKSTIRIVFPCELILVCLIKFCFRFYGINYLDNYRNDYIPFYTISFEIWCICSW